MLTINNTLDGFLKDVEIKGNTIQDTSNLADIRSVGDKVENQELYEIDVVSCGKNLAKPCKLLSYTLQEPNIKDEERRYATEELIPAKTDTSYMFSTKNSTTTKYVIWLDSSKNFISRSGVGNSSKDFKVQSPSNAKYCQLYVYDGNNTLNRETEMLTNEWQFIEGTQATPYEPYQEDKLTILSPVQLEKVGDVADRIICKDGVWGVEKNVETVVLDGESLRVSSLLGDTTGEYIRYHIPTVPVKTINVATINVLSNKLQATSQVIIDTLQQESISSHSGGGVQLKLNKAKGTTVTEINNYLKLNNIIVKYNGPSQFVPLPHDQQVKLRTFAGQTNIRFETEIEGTIKAQVPKSIGATVNTHTEQIDILNKKVFKIEEIDQVQQDMMILESDMRILDIELALMEHMPIKLSLANEGMLRSATYFNFIKNHIVNETYEKEYLENVINKYLATNRLTQEEYNELYKLLYPPVYDIELPIEE